MYPVYASTEQPSKCVKDNPSTRDLKRRRDRLRLEIDSRMQADS